MKWEFFFLPASNFGMYGRRGFLQSGIQRLTKRLVRGCENFVLALA